MSARQLSAPPGKRVPWTVRTIAAPQVSVVVDAETAWQAHLLAKLGHFSEVECKQEEGQK